MEPSKIPGTKKDETLSKQNAECGYGFTLRKTKLDKNVDKDTYKDHIKKIFTDKGYNVTTYKFEETTGLHCHGVVYIPETIDQKRFRFRGLHLYLVKIHDMEGWLLYINKDQKDDIPYAQDNSADDGLVNKLNRKNLF